MASSRNGPRLKWFLAGVAGGVLLLVGMAAGMTMTDQRPFCASCHVMQEAALTHKLSTHANLACNECHTPATLMKKLPFKAAEGIKDFVGNLRGLEAPVMPGVVTRDVINANCQSCHAMTNSEVASMEAKPYCVDCHRSVAHMRQKPISTRTVAYE